MLFVFQLQVKAKGGQMDNVIRSARASVASGAAIAASNERIPFDVFDTAGESRTFRLGDLAIMGLTTHVATASQIACVLYRAPHANGGYDAYVALSCILTSNGFYTNTRFVRPPGGVVFQVTLLIGENAPADQYSSPPTDLICESKRFFFKTAIDPDLFDIVSGVSVSVPQSHWLQCGIHHLTTGEQIRG